MCRNQLISCSAATLPLTASCQGHCCAHIHCLLHLTRVLLTINIWVCWGTHQIASRCFFFFFFFFFAFFFLFLFSSSSSIFHVCFFLPRFFLLLLFFFLFFWFSFSTTKKGYPQKRDTHLDQAATRGLAVSSCWRQAPSLGWRECETKWTPPI